MENTRPYQFSKDFEIRSYQVHPNGKLSLTALADIFQEIAWRHADSADFGRTLAEQNQSWILSRMEILCEKLPSWGDSIKAYTAGRGVDKLFAFREFLITDPNGRTIAKAMSSWVLMNMASKRLLRPEKVLPSALFDPTEKPETQPEKIKIIGEKISSEKVKVRYADLDLNNHVNNTSYIRWVENILMENDFNKPNFLINYLAECLLGDEVTISLWKNGDDYFVQGTVGERQVFTAKASD